MTRGPSHGQRLQLPPLVSFIREKTTLVAELVTLRFRQDTFRGVPMRRTIVCYGNDYDAQRHSARNPAAEIPACLAPLRDRAAAVAGVDAGTITQAIIWRYPAKIGIGWHVDNPAYGAVICGLSLAAPAVMKLKREAERHRFELGRDLSTSSAMKCGTTGCTPSTVTAKSGTPLRSGA